MSDVDKTTQPGLVNGSQVSGISERVAYGAAMAVAMKLVGYGIVSPDDAPWIAGGLVAAVGGIWAWWRNRPKGLVQAAAAVPGTTVITTAALSEATPHDRNIISNEEVKVVQK